MPYHRQQNLIHSTSSLKKLTKARCMTASFGNTLLFEIHWLEKFYFCFICSYCFILKVWNHSTVKVHVWSLYVCVFPGQQYMTLFIHFNPYWFFFSLSKICNKESLKTLVRKIQAWLFFHHIPGCLKGICYWKYWKVVWIHFWYLSCSILIVLLLLSKYSYVYSIDSKAMMYTQPRPTVVQQFLLMSHLCSHC